MNAVNDIREKLSDAAGDLGIIKNSGFYTIFGCSALIGYKLIYCLA